MKIILAGILLLLSNLTFAQLSPQGCQFVASVAAHAVLEAKGMEPKGSTLKTVQQILPKEGNAQVYDLIESLIAKYNRDKKRIPEQVFEEELMKCYSVQGDMEKMLPKRS